MPADLTIAQVRMYLARTLAASYSRAELVTGLGKLGRPIQPDDIERSNRVLAFRLAWAILPPSARRSVQLHTSD